MRDIKQSELEVLAEVGKLLISKLDGRDDLARAIFNTLIPQFQDRYPYHKLLSHLVLAHVEEKDESREDVIARMQGHGSSRPFPNLPDKF